MRLAFRFQLSVLLYLVSVVPPIWILELDNLGVASFRVTTYDTSLPEVRDPHRATFYCPLTLPLSTRVLFVCWLFCFRGRRGGGGSRGFRELSSWSIPRAAWCVHDMLLKSGISRYSLRIVFQHVHDYLQCQSRYSMPVLPRMKLKNNIAKMWNLPFCIDIHG